MMCPYRKLEVFVYCFLMSSPTIFIKFVSSALPVHWAKLASRTFSTLPRSGNTPYRSLPTTDNPATARDFAESPSVRIRVHSAECLPPASLASSSLGTPITRVTLAVLLFSFLPMSICSLALAQFSTKSTMPLAITFLMVPSESSHVDPNLLVLEVKVSLVCESKAGFSIREFTKIHRCVLICAGLMSIPPLFFLFTRSAMAATSWSAMRLTWVPPLVVLILFTKETCWKEPSEILIATSHLGPHVSRIFTAPSFSCRYRSI
mmetsp:Transcript_3117/g.7422  ORF Transcript_3117/g.7422 Transcript_3117/m.7422 type:complete len:262 (-) Transcript_3117:821-1606(-)